jgi:hypothetical protein
MKKTVLVLVFLLVLPLAFAESYEQLFPLGSLSGWSADDPNGMDMSSSGMSAVTAQREYTKGGQKITASIIVGQYMATGWNPAFQEGFSMNTPDGTIEVKRVDGFLVAHTHKKSDNSGVLIVLLLEDVKSGGVFAFAYQGLSAGDALGLAKKFDWGKMKSKVGSLS